MVPSPIFHFIALAFIDSAVRVGAVLKAIRNRKGTNTTELPLLETLAFSSVSLDTER